MRALGIPSKNEVHVLLVDRQGGTIVWRTTGSFDEAKGRALAQAIETYLRSGS
jgi:ribosomal protein S11